MLFFSEITKLGWQPGWKNALILERESGQYMDLVRPAPDGGAIPVRFFHIMVRNLHPHKIALNCYAYLTKAKNLSNNVELSLETVEFKWAGYTMPNANIFSSSQRAFDAVWFDRPNPSRPKFNTYSDSGRYLPEFSFPGKGEYELSYLVVSDNFPPCTSTFILRVGDKIDDFKLEQVRHPV